MGRQRHRAPQDGLVRTGGHGEPLNGGTSSEGGHRPLARAPLPAISRSRNRSWESA
ncbi:hypothetical protein SGPA1_10512 [Streptomyces misionensis JCM 4497]